MTAETSGAYTRTPKNFEFAARDVNPASGDDWTKWMAEEGFPRECTFPNPEEDLCPLSSPQNPPACPGGATTLAQWEAWAAARVIPGHPDFPDVPLPHECTCSSAPVCGKEGDMQSAIECSAASQGLTKNMDRSCLEAMGWNFDWTSAEDPAGNMENLHRENLLGQDMHGWVMRSWNGDSDGKEWGEMSLVLQGSGKFEIEFGNDHETLETDPDEDKNVVELWLNDEKLATQPGKRPDRNGGWPFHAIIKDQQFQAGDVLKLKEHYGVIALTTLKFTC